MQKATVTYRAPPGDNKVVEMGGVTFFDGKAIEINTYDNPHMVSKLKENPLFDVVLGKEDDQPPPKVKRGRPSNADIAAAKAASELADKEAAEAKAKAEAAKSDHEKLTKATDTEVTRQPAEGHKADVKAGMLGATSHDFEKDRQAEVERRDAQARGIGPTEQGPVQMGQPKSGPVQNATNQPYQAGAQNAVNQPKPDQT